MSYVLVIANSVDKHLGLFSDLESDRNSILHYVKFKQVSKWLLPLRRLHLSHYIYTKSVRLPYRSIWFDYGQYISLNDVKSILVINGAVGKVDFDFLNKCKTRGIKIYLLILDAMRAESDVMKGSRKLFFYKVWDEVFTFDPEDAKRYGFTYKGFCTYSKNNTFVNRVPVVMNDVYFSGNTKGGRSEIINSTYRCLSGRGCICKFDVQKKTNKGDTCNGINYVEKWIPYEEVLCRMLESNCILEIIQNNQSGPSLRYFEAIFYNKKLLTNNKNIEDYPYYNPKWMKTFDSPEEINVEWIKSHDEVDYQYKGEFSPVNFIKYLLEK